MKRKAPRNREAGKEEARKEEGSEGGGRAAKVTVSERLREGDVRNTGMSTVNTKETGREMSEHVYGWCRIGIRLFGDWLVFYLNTVYGQASIHD